MGCLRFAALIARQIPVALWVSGLLWIGLGIFTGQGPEGLGQSDSLLGGAALILAGVVALLPAWGLHRLLLEADSRREAPQLALGPGDFTSRLAQVFESHGYDLRPDLPLGEMRASFMAQKRQWYLIFPARDWFYIFFVEDGRRLRPQDIQALNQAAREHTNRHYRLPATLRLDIPMTATVIVSSTGFGYETAAYVRATRFFKGGDANDVFLLDRGREQIVHSEKRPASGYIPLDRAYAELVRFADLAAGR